MDPLPDSLVIARLQRQLDEATTRLDAALAANDLLAAAAMKPLGQLMQRIEVETAQLRADLLAERNEMPSHDPRLPFATKVVDALGAILGIGPAALPVAPNAVPEDTTPPAHTD